MSRLEQRLIDGHLAAKEQRERLKLRVAVTRDRLSPQRLLNDARTEAEHQVRATATSVVTEVQAHPVRTALLGSAVLAWVFRRPLLDHGPSWMRSAYAVVSGRYMPMGKDGVVGGDQDQSSDPDDQPDGDREHWPEPVVQQTDSR